MIVVDTSIWVSTLRDGTGAQASVLRKLLDHDRVALAAPVRVEILAGSKRSDLPRLRRTLAALPCWFPDAGTWSLIDTWVEVAVRAGQRFGVSDLLIGAIAEQHDAEIWSLDRDFERLARLDLLRVYGT